MCWNTRPLRGTLTMFLIMTYYDDKFVFSIWLTIDVKFVQCLHSSRDCNWYQPRTNLQWFFVHIGRTIEQQMTSIRIWISTWIITDQSPIFGIIISLPIKLPLKKPGKLLASRCTNHITVGDRSVSQFRHLLADLSRNGEGTDHWATGRCAQSFCCNVPRVGCPPVMFVGF